MSRSRKKYLAPDHGKKGRFPRRSKKVEQNFLDEDGGCTRVGMRAIHNIHERSYEPCRGVAADTRKMRRVLGKQVGRPWDDVKSEFLRGYDSRSFEGHTIREWLDFVVEENVIVQDDGRITDPRGLRVGYFWEELYVDPITKLLCLAPHERQKYRYTIEQKVFELDGTLYHEHEGLWYRVKMKYFEKAKRWWGYGYEYLTLVPPDVFVDEYRDFGTRRRVSFSYSKKYGLDSKGRGWYCIWKQSANSREIAKLKAKYDTKKAA